jgi:hypothetical protein
MKNAMGYTKQTEILRNKSTKIRASINKFNHKRNNLLGNIIRDKRILEEELKRIDELSKNIELINNI